MITTNLIRVMAALLVGTSLYADSVEFSVLSPGVLEQRLKLAHPKNAERYTRLRNLMQHSACKEEHYSEQAVKGSKEPNLVCTIAAEGAPKKILVGAHFDAGGGDGIVDNWSGAVLLPILSDAIARHPRRHTFQFIGFTAEEKGLVGSRAFVKALSKEERSQIAAVVILDSLGLSFTKYWPNGSTKELVKAAVLMANSLKLEIQGVEVGQVGTTDSEPFKEAHIPVLSLHSVTQETWPLINSSKDVWSAVSWQSYYDTHKLVSALLVYLDQNLP